THPPNILVICLAGILIMLSASLIGKERKNLLNDFTFSLPYKRSHIYLSKWLIGVSCLVGSILLGTIIDLTIIAISPYNNFLDWHYHLPIVVQGVVSLVALYTLALFLGTISGGSIVQVILTLIFSVFPVGIFFLCKFFLDV